MTRHLFAPGIVLAVPATFGAPVTTAEGSTSTYYTDPACTVRADLMTVQGYPIALATLTVDGGRVPDFYGPENVLTLYTPGAAGIPNRLDADLLPQFAALKLSGGVKGDTGAPGADGINGVNGMDGLPGAPGANGVDGARGTDGLPGVKGDPGLPGTNGVNGMDGLPGVKGDPGLPGINGTDGVDGARGADGLQGVKGDTGPAGTGGGTLLPFTGDPRSSGFAGWTTDPATAQNIYQPAAGKVHYFEIPVIESRSATKLLFYGVTSGATHTLLNLALYNDQGVKISDMPGVQSVLTGQYSSVSYAVTLPVALAVTAGTSIWLGLYIDASGMGFLGTGNTFSAGPVNVGRKLAGKPFRGATQYSTTTLPASGAQFKVRDGNTDSSYGIPFVGLV